MLSGLSSRQKRALLAAGAITAVVAFTIGFYRRRRDYAKIQALRAQLARQERLEKVPLAPPIRPIVSSESVARWRRNYRRFRVGAASGATGREATAFTMAPSLTRKATGSEFFGAEHHMELETAQAAITAWRLDYIRHRKGGARGAKGELADAIDADPGLLRRLLPALQEGLSKKALQAPSDQKTNKFHIHFGAGRLGLGLIIPTIAASDVPFAIVQRQSGDFKRLLGEVASEPGYGKPAEVVELQANGKAYKNGTLIVVKTVADLPEEWKLYLEALATGSAPPSPSSLKTRGLLILSDKPDIVEPLVRAATSFSTSLGPGIKYLGGSLLEALKDRAVPSDPAAKPALFAGENDHKAVDSLMEEVESKVEVVSCMVDRICTGREITNTGPGFIKVTSEPYIGAVVVLHPPPHVAAPPFAGDHVLVPRREAEADYLCKRKLLMVNGMHTTLAFLTLCRKVPDGVIPPLEKDKLQPPHAAYELITLKTAGKQDVDLIKCWAVARVLLLLFEHNHETIMGAHKVKTNQEVRPGFRPPIPSSPKPRRITPSLICNRSDL